MRVFFGYLKTRVKTVAVTAVCLSIVALFMIIYGLPTRAIVYAEAVCFTICAAGAAWDLVGYYRKSKLLAALKSEILLTLEHLPETDDGVEGGYRELIELLFEEKSAIAEASDRRYENSAMYFTLWTHQIKTPIAAMYLALRDAGQREEFPSELTDELTDELRKIERYAEMALCYIRLDGYSDDFVFGSCPLDRVIKNAVKRFSPQFIRKRIKLVYAPTKLCVLTDEKWLLFAAEQLISNALKYTREGSVEISARELDDRIELSVSDTGTGIPAEDLPRIFDRGFTGLNGRPKEGTLRASGAGSSTGIGLYLTKKICARLGHEITAENREPVGARFTIIFKSDSADTRD